MFTCLFFGDSLALGAAHSVNARLSRPCEVRAAIGVASATVARWMPLPRSFDTVVLSIGSNDDLGRVTGAGIARANAEERRRSRAEATIVLVRRSLAARRVIWLLPYDPARAGAVRTVAIRFGDEVLDLRRFATRDGVHPASYRDMAAALLR